MDLSSVRSAKSRCGLAARESYADVTPLLPSPLRYGIRRTSALPVLAQKKAAGGGTVKFKSAEPQEPAKGLFPGIGPFGTVQRKQGTVQLKGTASMRGRSRQRDPKTIFVAGATGTLGSRIIRELLGAGFKVRAGCANIEEAERDLDVLVRYGIVAADQSRNVSFVETNWNEEDGVLASVGNAGRVVFTGEGGPPSACIALAETCEELGVGQFVLVSSGAGAKSGSSGSLFGGFSGPPASMKQAQASLENSTLSFTVIQPGDMRISDETSGDTNVVVGKSGQISKLQVAQLVAGCFFNAGLAENKVLAVSADATAEYKPFEDLLSQTEAIITKEAQLAKQAERQELQDSIAALAEKVTSLEAEEQDAKERLVALKDRVKEVQTAQKAKRTEASAMLRASSQIERQLDTLRQNLEDQEKEEAVARALYMAAQKASRESRVLSKEEVKDIEFIVLNPEIAKQREEEEAQRRKEEAEAAKAAQEEENRLAAEAKKQEEAAKKAELEAAKAKAAEDAAKKQAEAKMKAQAEAEQKKKAAEEAKMKAQAEAEQRKKAAEEAKMKAQAEAEAKRKAEEEAKAEAKAKAEAEAKAKAEAEAKRKAEAEAKAKAEAEAEAKRKAEEEARIKADVEAKAKAEAEAEAKRKAEEEAKAAAEAEAKAKAEAEEAARLKAEAKKKAEEEAKAAAEAKAKAFAAAEEARRQKAAEAQAKAAQRARQQPAAQPFANFFGGFKAPWDQQPASQQAEEDRPTARAWIEAWRAKQRGEIPAKEWIQNWKDKQSNSKIPDDREDARKWLEEWRSSLK